MKLEYQREGEREVHTFDSHDALVSFIRAEREAGRPTEPGWIKAATPNTRLDNERKCTLIKVKAIQAGVSVFINRETSGAYPIISVRIGGVDDAGVGADDALRILDDIIAARGSKCFF